MCKLLFVKLFSWCTVNGEDMDWFGLVVGVRELDCIDICYGLFYTDSCDVDGFIVVLIVLF